MEFVYIAGICFLALICLYRCLDCCDGGRRARKMLEEEMERQIEDEMVPEAERYYLRRALGRMLAEERRRLEE